MWSWIHGELVESFTSVSFWYSRSSQMHLLILVGVHLLHVDTVGTYSTVDSRGSYPKDTELIWLFHMQNALSPVINSHLLFIRAVWSKKVQQKHRAQHNKCCLVEDLMNDKGGHNEVKKVPSAQSHSITVVTWKCHGNYQKMFICSVLSSLCHVSPIWVYTLWYMLSISVYFMSLPCSCSKSQGRCNKNQNKKISTTKNFLWKGEHGSGEVIQHREKGVKLCSY